MIVHSLANKIYLHKKVFALSLVLKVRNFWDSKDGKLRLPLKVDNCCLYMLLFQVPISGKKENWIDPVF